MIRYEPSNGNRRIRSQHKDLSSRTNDFNHIIPLNRSFDNRIQVVRLENRGLYLLISVRTKTSRSEEHTSELQSRFELVCRPLLDKKNRASTTSGRVCSCRRARSTTAASATRNRGSSCQKSGATRRRSPLRQ